MEPKVLYRDAIRTVRVVEGLIAIESRGLRVPPFGPRGFAVVAGCRPEAAERIRAMGDDPAEYGCFRTGAGWINMPMAACNAIGQYAEEIARKAEEIRIRPENVERRRIELMFAKAEMLQDDPGEYFPARERALAALRAWAERYPQAAADAKRREILAAADEQDRLAAGALVYDCDGSLNAEMRERRAADYKAEAARLRREASRITHNNE